MKALAKALGISRQALYKRRKAALKPRRRKYQPKAEDEAILAEVRPLLGERPSYGYRRLTALLNRQRGKDGRPRVNPKRIYRILRYSHMLLQKHTGRPLRVHDGTVHTPLSNQRWCADDFEIRCDDGQVVRVAFSLDCCDREVLSYVATTRGIGSYEARELIVGALENRFGKLGVPPFPIEWLTDNGPGYTARKTVAFGRSAGLLPCTTAPYSPESNGMAESFVKTMKRDYVAFGNLANPEIVMEQLPGWFWDYNHCHPHKALGMLSPMEFMSLHLRS